MKRFKLITALFLGIAVLTLCLSACNVFVDKGEVWLESVQTVVRLQEDGSAVVEETWKVKVSSEDDKRNFYKVIGLYDEDFPTTLVEIEDFTVLDNDSGKVFPMTSVSDPSVKNANKGRTDICYLYGNGSRETEMGCYVEPLSSGRRNLTFRYTLTNMVAQYEDYAVLYFQQFSEAFELYIGSYDCKIYLPDNAATAGSRGWFHSETAGSYLTIENDYFHYTAEKIAAGTQVETRVLAPQNMFSGAHKQGSESVGEKIINEENEWQTAWEAKLKKERTAAIVSVTLMCLLFVAGVAYVIVVRAANKRVKDEYPEYVRDIPADNTAAEMGHFYYYYDGGVEKKNLRGRLLSATIMELTRRGFTELQPDMEGDYSIAVQSVPEAQLNDLKPHERTMYLLLSRVQAYTGHPFTMKEFTAYSKANYNDIDVTIKAFITESKQRLLRGNYIGTTKKYARYAPLLGILCGIIGAAIFVLSTYYQLLGVGFVGLGVALLFGTPQMPKLNKAGEKEYATARGLGRFMLEFSALDEHEIPQLVLWEEYMVYATMMGISEQVLKALKLKYPELSAEPTTDGYYTNRSYLYTYVWLSSSTRGGFHDLGSQMDSCFTNIRNTANALAHPVSSGGGKSGRGGFGGFGGGGFGGGGGGFGGGGGGAR